MPSWTQPIPWRFNTQNSSTCCPSAQPVRQSPRASACLRPPDYGNNENVNILSPGAWDVASCAPQVPPQSAGGRAGLPLPQRFGGAPSAPAVLQPMNTFWSRSTKRLEKHRVLCWTFTAERVYILLGGRTRRKKKGAKPARWRSNWALPC